MSEQPIEGGRPPFDRTRFINRFLFGLVMLTLGVLWTLDNLDVVEAGKILAWWPAATLAWGLVLLFGVFVNRCRTLGAIWIGIGLIGGFDALHLGRFSALDLFPLFLVVIGGLIVLRAWRRRAFGDGGGDLFRGPGGSGPGVGAHGGGGAGGGGERANFFSMLGGTERRVTAQEFTGGEASAILGGLTLDLRGARLAPRGAVLDLFAMWGGIEIIAPPGWRVLGHVTPLLGAYVDSMPTAAADAPTLELRGLAVMGGVDVRSDDSTRRKLRRTIVGAYMAPGVRVGVIGSRRRDPADED